MCGRKNLQNNYLGCINNPKDCEFKFHDVHGRWSSIFKTMKTGSAFLTDGECSICSKKYVNPIALKVNPYRLQFTPFDKRGEIINCTYEDEKEAKYLIELNNNWNIEKGKQEIAFYYGDYSYEHQIRIMNFLNVENFYWKNEQEFKELVETIDKKALIAASLIPVSVRYYEYHGIRYLLDFWIVEMLNLFVFLKWVPISVIIICILICINSKFLARKFISNTPCAALVRDSYRFCKNSQLNKIHGERKNF